MLIPQVLIRCDLERVVLVWIGFYKDGHKEIPTAVWQEV